MKWKRLFLYHEGRRQMGGGKAKGFQVSVEVRRETKSPLLPSVVLLSLISLCLSVPTYPVGQSHV